MNILKYAFHVTPIKRRVIAVLAMVVALTSTDVQAASASEVLPEPTVWVTDSLEVHDTTQERGILVPDLFVATVADEAAVTEQPAAEPPKTEKKIEKPKTGAVTAEKPVKAKNVWNTVQAADVETKAARSSDSAIRTMVVPTTAYTSDPAETDSTPFTTADGSRVHDGVIAANFLKFGTRVRIPDQFGDKVFVVHDRMNARYNQRMDIWMTNKADAFTWGVRRVKIEILP